MGRINILEPSVFNMLAAGEVVERPSSVVKELVENSIDAGATVVDVNISRGGEALIEVSDNGIGIDPEDMRAAFLPHATSKLSAVTDLDSISTLGFRGEALASIASVSEVTLTSSRKGSASKIALSAGKVTFEGLASRNEGTVIAVENLFFNTPARLKFLKKPAVEQRYIEEILKKLILANPNISFSLTADGQEVLSHSAGTLFDAVCSVYGARFASEMIKIDDFSRGGITVRGYVSSPEKSRATRMQTFIINGRAVSDQTMQTAAEKAYGDLLMKRSYPVLTIDVIMPFDQVDVNVHPSKTEVRFADKQAVFGAIYHAVYDAVHEGSERLGFDIGAGKAEDKYDPAGTNIATNSSRGEFSSLSATPQNASRPTYTQPRIDSSRYFTATPPKNAAILRDTAIGAFMDDNVQDRRDEKEDEPVRIFDGKIVGQVFDTYLIVERDEVMYVIDQHAAHERVLYDKISAKMTPEYAQSLLIPYKLTLSVEEEEIFDDLTPSLAEMGFEIERRTGSVVINAVPEPVARINFSKFFRDLFAINLGGEKLTLADVMRESLCQQACKAAIKGGEALTNEQIERVIRNYLDKDGNLPDKCPHGRPAVIAIGKSELEKMFKRIV